MNRSSIKPTRRIKLNVHEPCEQAVEAARRFDSRIVGQKPAKDMVARAYRRFLNPLRDKRRPIYSAMLLGEPGQGKTLTAEELAFLLHGDPTAYIKVNCGAYKEKHRVSQLIGAPAGYVGYSDPKDEEKLPKSGKLDPSAKLSMHNKVASRKGSPTPVTVILLDEIEKMHPDLEDVLLSILDKAEVDFGNNTVGDFSDCVILMAGNIGSFEVSRLGRRMGFVTTSDSRPTHDDIRSTIFKVLEERYKPEFIDRIDEVVIYETLSASQKRLIVDVEIAKLEERIMSELPRGFAFTLKVDDRARDFIHAQATAGKGSARKLKRLLNGLLEEPLGNELAKKTIRLGDLVEVTYESGETLSFYMVEGEGDVAEADTMIVSGPDNMGGLAFQRKVDRALRKAARAEKALFEITIEADSQSQLAVDTHDLIGELTRIYGVAIVRTSNSWEAPWILTAVVRGIPEQIELFKTKNPACKVREHAAGAEGSGK